MRERIIIVAIFFMAAACAFAKEACSKELTAGKIMEKIAQKGAELESFSADIVYSLTQEPDIFETTTTYTGTFKYLETDERQYAMIDFVTRQEDELPEEEYHQRFVFDGVWLERIDYRLKQVNRDQLAPEDEPEDVFKLVSEDFPLMGFSGTDKLLESYEVELVESEKDNVYKLSLEPKKDSNAKYSDIEFVIDKQKFLPLSIKAKSLSDNSICDIKLKNSRVNPSLEEEIFKLSIPDGFTVSEKKLAEGSEQ